MLIRMALCVLLLLSACAVQPAFADSLLLGGWSKHLIKGDFNEQHDLVAYKRDKWSGGTFVNSYYRRTYFFGYSPDRFTYKSYLLDAGIDFVVTYGYRTCFGDDNSSPNVCPLPVPYIDIKAGSSIHPRFLLFGPALGVSIKVDF